MTSPMTPEDSETIKSVLYDCDYYVRHYVQNWTDDGDIRDTIAQLARGFMVLAKYLPPSSEE